MRLLQKLARYGFQPLLLEKSVQSIHKQINLVCCASQQRQNSLSGLTQMLVKTMRTQGRERGCNYGEIMALVYPNALLCFVLLSFFVYMFVYKCT
jgi:hypothetical protein